MPGTALIINDDNKVTVFEDVLEKNLDEIQKDEVANKTNGTISVVFQEDVIDWEYGY